MSIGLRISELVGRRVGILGLGAEGSSVLRALDRAGHQEPVVVLGDHEPVAREGTEPTGPAIQGFFGDAQLRGLEGLEILVRSPGFPPTHPTLVAAQDRGLPQTTSTQLFLAEARAGSRPVVGITGSKGKSTTASLLHKTLEAAGIPAALVGNIGRPALDQLPESVASAKAVVFELSSYQCHDLGAGEGPSIAVLLDLFPEHMDWHGGVQAYYDAKLNLAHSQRPGDRFFYNAAAARTWQQASGAPFSERLAALPQVGADVVNDPAGLHFADAWFRRGGKRLFQDTRMLLPGLHNRRNACSALAAAEILGATPQHLEETLATFRPLPHRLEDLGVHGGIRWVDDSISTAPEAAAAALEALSGDPPGSVATLIAGGLDRGYDFAPLAEAANRFGLRHALLTGTSAKALAAAIEGTEVQVEILPDLAAAVARARQVTPPGATCLLSPASPSYGAFKSFEERGRRFQELARWKPGLPGSPG